MAEFVIWHNPRCSKSRKTLEILEQANVNVTVRTYLDDIPSIDEINSIVRLLGVKLVDIVRTGEKVFGELGLSKNDSDEKLLVNLVNNPILIERPIVIKDSIDAVIGRPPENVKKWL